jgi:hypothetical protein
MRTQDQVDRLQTRRNARAGACRWHVCAVASRSGIVAMLGTLFTAKINPSGVPPGGDPSRDGP